MTSDTGEEIEAERYAPAPDVMPPTIEPVSLDEARAQRLRIVIPADKKTGISWPQIFLVNS